LSLIEGLIRAAEGGDGVAFKLLREEAWGVPSSAVPQRVSHARPTVVQRPNSLFELPDSLSEKEEVAETGGIVFSNGRCFELIRNDTGRLGLFDSSNKKVVEKIEFQGRTFVPPTIHPSILEVLTLPTGRAPSGATADIFSRMCTLFMEHSVSEQVAKNLAYWTLSSLQNCFRWLPVWLLLVRDRKQASFFSS
jgi:hypothetical protein